MLFFASAAAILALMHGYLWRRLVHDTRPPRRARRVLTALLVALPVLMMVSAVAVRISPTQARRVSSTLLYGWLGGAFYLALGLLALDAGSLSGRVARRGARRRAPVDAERRRFLARAVAGVAGAAAATTTAWGVRCAFEDAEVTETTVRIPSLLRRHSGLTLVQISDLHVGPTLDGRFVSRLVDRAMALSADAIVLTGDLVDGSVAHLHRAMAPLHRLRAPLGVFAVTGNHEYYAGADEWVATLRAGGVHVLRNQRVRLDGGLDLCGVDDWSARRHGFGRGYDLDAALHGRESDVPAVLLAHQPRGVERAVARGIALQLSGHTHGGQLWPFGAVVALAQPFVVGLHAVGQGHIFVTRGAGFWGPPMRVGAPPELARIALV